MATKIRLARHGHKDYAYYHIVVADSRSPRENCGGNFVYTKDGIKDCSGCLRPHKRECYEEITKKVAEVMKMVQKEG